MSNAIALNKGDDDRGHYISVQSAFMDISKLKHKKELISNIIRHAPLTDVLNRSAYEYDMDLIKSDFLAIIFVLMEENSSHLLLLISMD